MRSASAPPAPPPQLSKLQAPFHPPSAPGVNNFFAPRGPRPCVRAPAAPRGPGTSPVLRCGREASAGGEEKLGGAPGAQGRRGLGWGVDGAEGRERSAPLPRLLLLLPPLPVACKQQPELPSARAAEMSSPSPPPPMGTASAAISASEKVDGFTRKSVRKAQRQKRSQGSSQFRSQGSQAELHPLPQLKGNLRGRSRGLGPGAQGFVPAPAEPFPCGASLCPARGL